MADFQINFDDFLRRADEIGAARDQVPFALANAMTSAAFRTKTLLATDTWPKAVESRNKNFLRAALHVEPARKHDLTVSIVDTLGRANLAQHADGGTERPRSSTFAIPPAGSVKRTARGVAASQRPRAIIANTPKRALRITPRGIFIGIGGRLHLKFSFKPSAQIKRDVPFREDFARYMAEELKRTFVVAMERAMRTRR